MVMEPIILTKSGDTLTPSVGAESGGKFVYSHGGRIGAHSCGGGEFYLIAISSTHYRILCECCGRSLEPPKSVDGYDELRQWCATQIRAERYHKLQFEIMWGALPLETRQLIHQLMEREEYLPSGAGG